MRMLLVMVVVVALVSMAQARVWTTIYRCDETTPLAAIDPNQPSVYRDIMVGTKLAVVVKSDSDEYWFGRLQSSIDERYFSLTGRGYDEKQWSYAGSCLPPAGKKAGAWDLFDIDVFGLEFTTDTHPSAGDWFILDYQAEQVGPCSLKLYDSAVSLEVPIETHYLTHVPSRDFDRNAIVDFEDLAVLASHWRTTIAPDPNSGAIQYDLNSDGLIDIGDLTLFNDYWLERTDCNEPAADPNDPLNP